MLCVPLGLSRSSKSNLFCKVQPECLPSQPGQALVKVKGTATWVPASPPCQSECSLKVGTCWEGGAQGHRMSPVETRSFIWAESGPRLKKPIDKAKHFPCLGKKSAMCSPEPQEFEMLLWFYNASFVTDLILLQVANTSKKDFTKGG